MRLFELWALTGIALFLGHMVRTMNVLRPERTKLVVVAEEENVVYVKAVPHRSSA